MLIESQPSPPWPATQRTTTAIQKFVLFDRLEAWNADDGNGLAWEALGWVGTDLNRLWLRSEGDRVDDTTESADLEVLYGRSISRVVGRGRRRTPRLRRRPVADLRRDRPDADWRRTSSRSKPPPTSANPARPRHGSRPSTTRC